MTLSSKRPPQSLTSLSVRFSGESSTDGGASAVRDALRTPDAGMAPRATARSGGLEAETEGLEKANAAGKE